MAHEHAPKHENGHEHHIKTEFKEHEQRIEVGHNEKAAEASRHHSAESEAVKARRAAELEAVKAEELKNKAEELNDEPEQPAYIDRDGAFRSIMHHTREGLKKPEKTFSKVIHQPAVEKVSDVAGKTVARPSGIIGATVAAFIGLLSVYGIAKFAGFPLSGSEMPLLLAAGFALGLFVEWIYKSARAIFKPAESPR